MDYWRDVNSKIEHSQNPVIIKNRVILRYESAFQSFCD